jgi:lipoate-protein ligase A
VVVSGAGWSIERRLATVAELHGAGVPADPERTVRVCQPTDAALVLGSAQKDAGIDHAAVGRHGLHVVRRVSGGGAVLVEPGALVWIDVIVPKTDPLWNDDVGKAFHWLGRTWKAVLETAGVDDVVVHEGAMVNTMWSRTICFAGLGPGEVLANGRKVVGISQRRTRAAALFQCSLLLRFDAERMVELFSLEPDEADAAVTALGDFVTAVSVDPGDIVEAFIKSLETQGI